MIKRVVSVILSVIFLNMISLQINAKCYTFLIDTSGSIAGMSENRKTNSIETITSELLAFSEKKIESDTIRIITFTDRIISDIKSTDVPKSDFFNGISSLCPQKGNSDIISAIDYVEKDNTQETVVLISDGLCNVKLINKTDADIVNNNCKYALILNEKDLSSPLYSIMEGQAEICKFIHSLNEINDSFELKPVSPDQTSANVSIIKPVTKDINSSESISIDWEKISVFSVIILVIVCVLILLYYLWPAFSQTSIEGIARFTFAIFKLPKFLFNIVIKIIPNNFKRFLSEEMPEYDNFKRGYVRAQNESQRKLFKELEDKGIKLKYKNGDIDFEPAAEYSVKLPEGIKTYAQGSDPRKTIFKAQEEAGRRMLSDKRGQNIISKYVNKKPSELTFDDYTSWKDDRLNNFKNPKTPHESLDGKSILYVPKRIHDAGLGGLSHRGGVSILKSIRTHFPNAV